MKREKIGIGIITCNRLEYLKELWIKHFNEELPLNL